MKSDFPLTTDPQTDLPMHSGQPSTKKRERRRDSVVDSLKDSQTDRNMDILTASESMTLRDVERDSLLDSDSVKQREERRD